MASFAALVGSGIKSIQRGVSSVSSGVNNITISAVATGKAELRLLGFASGVSTAQIALTSATNIQITSGTSGTVSWELTENY